MIVFSLTHDRVLYPCNRPIISGGETKPHQNRCCGHKVTVEALFRFVLLIHQSSFIGVILVSLSPSKQPAHIIPHTLVSAGAVSHVIIGNILALISALFYALYVILLKVSIKAEYRIDMQLFFGFVGLFNIVFLWPLGLMLHLTGGEIFELPHTKKAVYAIALNVRSIALRLFAKLLNSY